MNPAPKFSVAIDPMASVRAELERLRQSPCTPVLLVGPAGAGKQHTAELLHRLSCPADAPFVSVDCGALPRELSNSELFGHERGAFAGATTERRGLLEVAQGGSLLLHQVTALPRSAQSLLLRFLDGMRLRRLGAPHDIELSLRVIATSATDPRPLVESGQFHEDLYRRLSAFRIDVPTLEERAAEILPLAHGFLEHFAARTNKAVHGFSDEARARLVQCSFPGNVRELRTLIERAVIGTSGPLLELEDLSLGERRTHAAATPADFFRVAMPSEGVPPPLDSVEHAYVRRVLEHTGGKRMAAAQLLGISYPTFLKRLRELGLDSTEPVPRSSVSATNAHSAPAPAR